MAFNRVKNFTRQLWNPKSHVRRTFRKIGAIADRTLLTTSKALRLASPALAAAGVPGLAQANAALGGYERIRQAVKG